MNPQLQDECKADSSWGDFWNAEFQRQGWVKPQPGVTLYHYFRCEWMQIMGFGAGYYRLLDTISLYEANVVFDLHGKFFRKRAELFTTHRMMTTMGDRLAAAQQGFLPRSIMEFSTNLALGKRTVPVISPVSSPHGNDESAKRIVSGVLEQFGWETADMGKVEAARAIEPLCMLWCIPGLLRQEWKHAFKLLR